MNKQENSRTLMSVYFGGTDEVFRPSPFTVPAGKVLRCYLEDGDSEPVEPAPEKSWHEKGERYKPLESTEKAEMDGYRLLEMLDSLNDKEMFEFQKSPEAKALYSALIKFRPLKTERERFVEAALAIIKDEERRISTVFELLYDAGFKAPEVVE